MKTKKANFGKVVTLTVKKKSCKCPGTSPDKCSCDPQCNHCKSQAPKSKLRKS